MTPARITITEKHEDECWEAFCVCGWGDASAMAIEMLEAAWTHYTNVQHNGFLFIDVRPALVLTPAGDEIGRHDC